MSGVGGRGGGMCVSPQAAGLQDSISQLPSGLVNGRFPSGYGPPEQHQTAGGRAGRRGGADAAAASEQSRAAGLNTDQFIEPEIAQYPKST